MNVIETLRIAEREELLRRLVTSLEADSRTAAVLLHGSLGRGAGDAWSDLDLWVVIFDDDYSDSIRHSYADGVLFSEEAPQNSPPGGSYLMCAYDAPTGPHLVDWYFQPRRFAEVAAGRKLLFDRAPFLAKAQSAPARLEWQPGGSENVANIAALFWAMLLIQAKYIARKPVEDGMGFEGFILTLLRNVAGRQNATIDERETPDLRYAAEKLIRLRCLGERMAKITPEFAPPRAAVERFFDTVIEAIHATEEL